jgi:hypothetical protein
VDHAGPGDESQSASSAYQSFLFTAGSAEEAAYFAALRERFDEEMGDRVELTRTLRGRPRPLTDSERSRLRETIAPVLRDIQASGAILPTMREETQDGVDGEWISVMLWSPDGTGMGVFIPTEPTAADQVVRLAEQVQEWEIEELASAGRSATWPECPEHPNSHPLEPVAADRNRAAWRCPRSGHVISQVGALGK